MGRWLKKLDSLQSKLTNNSSVSFVSTNSEEFHKNNTIQETLIDFVSHCCKGLIIQPQQVIDCLLSFDDEQDIINGNVPTESLRLHIELWLNAGKPHYSGKSLAK